MTNQFAIGVICLGLLATFWLTGVKLLGGRGLSWLLVLTPFLLAWFYITYGYAWMLYEWR